MTDDTPRMKKTLKMFEPIIFPTAISFSFFIDALIDVTISGSDVPTATMVKPIKSSERPNFSAIPTAASTVTLPPKITPAKPSIIPNAILV